MWSLRVGYVPGHEFSGTIRKLLGQCTSDLEAWRLLRREARLDLFCGLHLDDWNRGLEIDPDVLALLGDRELLLSLDIYGDSPEEVEEDEPWKR